MWRLSFPKCRQHSLGGRQITPTQTSSSLVGAVTKILPQTISNGVDLKQFTPTPLRADRHAALRARLNLPLEAPIILYVGRLDKDKGVDRVIMAAAQAMHGNQAHLLVVGDGTQKTALMSMCRTLGIAERSHFPGAISMQAGLPEIYRLAELFVTASEIETQGIVLLEAAASGVPIVAGRATCIPELVQDGVNGLLTRPGDIDELGQAIHAMLHNPIRSSMGLAGRALAMEHDIELTLERYESSYHEVLSRRLEFVSADPSFPFNLLKWIRRLIIKYTAF